jgi:hypothetical protein
MTRSTCGRRCKDKISSKGNNDDKKKKKKKNNCPHCKKLGRRQPHPNTPHDKCYWNKNYKGWRPRLICDKLEVAFKPRLKSSVELGGWLESNKWRCWGSSTEEVQKDDGWIVVTKGFWSKLTKQTTFTSPNTSESLTSIRDKTSTYATTSGSNNSKPHIREQIEQATTPWQDTKTPTRYPSTTAWKQRAILWRMNHSGWRQANSNGQK